MTFEYIILVSVKAVLSVHWQLLFLVPECGSSDWEEVFADKVRQFDNACTRQGILDDTKIALVRDPSHYAYHLGSSDANTGECLAPNMHATSVTSSFHKAHTRGNNVAALRSCSHQDCHILCYSNQTLLN